MFKWRRKKKKQGIWQNYQVLPFGGSIFLGGWYVFRTINTTFNGITLLFLAFLVGLVLSFFLCPIIEKRDQHASEVPGGIKDYRGAVRTTIICIAIGLAGMLNANFLSGNINKVEAPVLYKHARTGKGSSWTVHIDVKPYGSLDLSIDETLWSKLSVGDDVLITIQKGLLDFYVVTSVKALTV